MRIAVLASGSSGNALLLTSNTTAVLVDAGISARRIEAGLAATGLDGSALDAVLVTHEHGDHVTGLGPIARRCRLPVYATPGTHSMIGRFLGGCEAFEVEPGESFGLGDLSIWPFSVSHDCADPVGYAVTDGVSTVAVATDLGHVGRGVRHHLASADCVVLESNHDERMLLDGPYPWHLKQRILSNVGHLSNSDASSELEAIAHGPLATVILAHVSKENNTLELARETAAAALARAGRPDVDVLAAGPAGVPGPIDVGRRSRATGERAGRQEVPAPCRR